jgi:hypothetical protein
MTEVEKLVRLENELRSDYTSLNEYYVKQYSERIAQEFSSYWQEFARVLLLHALRRSSLTVSKKESIQADLCHAFEEPWRSLICPEVAHQ